MPRTATDVSEDLKRLKLNLADLRKALVDTSRRARRFKIVIGDRKKLAEVKNAIDQTYKNIK